MKSLSYLALSVLTVPVLAAAAFPDVPSSHPHAEAISYVKAEGIVQGNPDGTYQPDQNISRAAFTKIVVETYFSADELSSCSTGTTSFSDVDASAWFAPYVCVAANNSLVAGYPDGTFRPGDNINLVEAAKIISAHRKGERTGSPWYEPYLDDLGMAGVIPTQVIAVDQTVSRGLMAEMIHRLDAGIETKPALMFVGGRFETKGEMMAKEDSMVKAETSVQGNSEASVPVISSDETTVEANASVEASLAAPVYENYSPERYQSLINSGEAFVLNFSASWCPNCQKLDKTLREDLEALPDGTIILKTDYDAETKLKQQYGVTRQTTGVFIENGVAVETKSGLSFNDIKTFFE